MPNQTQESRTLLGRATTAVAWIILILLLVLLLATPRLVAAGSSTASYQSPPLRVGMIGLDNRHVPRFVQILNDDSAPNHVAGARVVVAYSGETPASLVGADIERYVANRERYTRDLQEKWGVEIVDSIEELSRRVDAVILTSLDGASRVEQVGPVLQAGRPVFIDRPFTTSVADALAIIELSRKTGTPIFSASVLRFTPKMIALPRNFELGEILGAIAYDGAGVLPPNPDLFGAGIHSVEMLYALMGPGCETVTRVYAEDADGIVARWKDGRIGMIRGIRRGASPVGAVAFGSAAVLDLNSVEPPEDQRIWTGYSPLMKEVVRFFQTGEAPVPPEETLEVITFLEAASLSRRRNGAPVALSEVLPASALQ